MSYTIDHRYTSPNRSSRNGAAVSMLVIHATVGSYASSLAWLLSPTSGVSSHYLIAKSGYIAQLVDDRDAAWHAGKSAWRGLTSQGIQACSIGVELENANTGSDPYPPIQLEAATWLCRQLITRFTIVPEMVARHLDIATPRGRKTDPAGLPWPAFRDGLFVAFHTVIAGPHGAIAQEDRRPGALSARFYPPNTPIVCDDVTSSYWHTQDGSGFIPVGQVQA